MTTAFDPHADLAYSTVAVPPSPAVSGASLTLATGHGPRFGTTAPFWVLAWAQSALATPDSAILLRVTAISGDTLTLDRTQDRLTARTILPGDQIMAPLTAEAVLKIEVAVNALETTVAALGSASTHAATDFLAATLLGAANGVASLDGSGKILSGQLPAFSGAKPFVVTSDAAMLALAKSPVPIAIRTDLTPPQTFIYNGGVAGTDADWTEIQASEGVVSVNGKTGSAVTLAPTDVGADPTGAATAVKGLPIGLTGATAAGRYVGTTTSGAPTTGTFVTGDWATDQAGKRWTCTAGGNPGTWSQEPGTGGSGVSITSTDDSVTVGGTTSAPTLVVAGKLAEGNTVVDMCGPPYNCTPGTDVTTALQTAITAANTHDVDTTLFFSTNGTYNVHGAHQFGNASSYTYCGQILFPARGDAAGLLSIVIRGSLTAPALANTGATTNPQPPGGVILETNNPAAAVTTLNTALTTGSGITSMQWASCPYALPIGFVFTTVSGGNTQQWTLTAAVAATGSPVTVQCSAATPLAGSQVPNFAYPIGSTIQTNGWIFDTVAASTSLYPHSDYSVMLEDITLTNAASNPLTGAFNGSALSVLATRGNVGINTAINNNYASTLPTGGNIALIFAPYDNGGGSIHQSGTLWIQGYTFGLKHSEHFSADYLYIQSCAAATLVVGGGANYCHMVQYKNLLLQGCPIGIMSQFGVGNGIVLEGVVDYGDTGGATAPYYLQYLVYDPGNVLAGELRVHGYMPSSSNQNGFPVWGCNNLKFKPLRNRVGQHACDTFNRTSVQATFPNTVLGVTDQTHHVWVLQSTQAGATCFVGASGAYANLANKFCGGTVRQHLGRSNCSRLIRTVVTLGAVAYQVYVIANSVISGANAGNRMAVQIESGTVSIGYMISTGAYTNLATSAASVVAASTKYTVDVVVSNPVGAAYPTYTVYVNNASVVTYTLTSGDATAGGANLVDTDVWETADGFAFFGDITSLVSQFLTAPVN